jgi:DNA replication protein DnaC
MNATSRFQLEGEARTEAIHTLERKRPHRYSPDGPDFWGQKCDGCGVVRPPNDVFGLICECERAAATPIIENYVNEHRDALIPQILDRARIPRRYERCTFASFKERKGTEDALTVTRVWAGRFTLATETGLFLAGSFGSGKSHLATAALRTTVERTLVEARFVSAGALVSEVRSGERIDWKPVEDAIRAELLLLDDLGQEAGTEFTRDIVARVIIGRYDEARPTIITSNHGPAALTNIFGGAITSRIHEMTSTQVLNASDYRATEAKA